MFVFVKLGVSPNLFLSCDFLLLLLFLTICFFFHMLDRILIKPGQNDQWVSGYKRYQPFDPKSQAGVTGVKKVILTKKVSTHLHYVAGSRDSCIVRSLLLSTISSQVNQRSLGVTGVKNEVKLQTTSNDKSNNVNVLVLGTHA